ncbi:hypothetical protein [Pseudonocardia sp. H11422]|uniref:hypothetical protein n=1 Tax=Pseudonocardia sp. H11422 TaxID=2835866 RepID=UPI001BDCF13D|nr:hypothetical protein [Pseudonocardia sp. H11422]
MTAELQGRLAMVRAAADSQVEVLRAQVQGLEMPSWELRRPARDPRRRTAGRSR